jgi:hypothetical protein
MTPISLVDARALALQIAPELADAELRLVRHQSDWPILGDADAYALPPGRFYPLRAYLEGLHAWQGVWGSTVVFVAEPTVELLLHELAHLLPAEEPLIDERPAPPDEYAASHTALRFTRTTFSESKRVSKPWLGHGIDFIRTLVHLIYRAGELGHFIRLPYTFHHELYGLSDIWQYQLQLGCEPLALSHRTFSEIENIDEPEPFMQLFRKDTHQ